MPKQPSSVVKGFTLIELMVTISIAAITMTMAIPSFIDTIRSNRLTATANEFVAALNFARSEAVKRGQQVTITRISTTAAQWESGWDVFVDSDTSNAFNDDGDANLCETNGDGSPAEDCLLRTHAALNNGITMRTSTGTNYQNFAAYSISGASKNHVGETFRLCSSDNDTSKSRGIIMNFMGRPKVATGTTSCP